ncbi:type II toxin-antitoxin system VapC family toxin [Hyphomonadaceae bacterium BL14]|nr:type II toxin-antitoxin system VapC family toxin [Hyphomonadaceae bacterium BL14]
MSVVCDTHAYVWFVTGDRKLSPAARERMINSDCWLSVVSVWEMSVKAAAGRTPGMAEIARRMARDGVGKGFSLMGVEMEDALAAGALPLHHRDPFDRMIIAQAQRRGLPVVSVDAVMDAYGLERIWRSA